MGYSNVQGSLNVLSSTSTDTLVVRGGTLLNGDLTAMNGFHNFGNVSIGNLFVTGNFTITATNTQVTNALSINNAGTSTALKVVQYEGGGPGHAWNVAEFWDYQTLAMVIDPEGNVGIHTGSSPGYALTVLDGAYIDTVTSQLYSGNASGLSNLQSTNLVGALAPYQLQASQTNITSVGDLSSLKVLGNSNLATLNVTGNSNLVTLNASSIFGLNLNVTGISNLSTIVTNNANIYDANIINIVSAGFTSNSTNTVFNFDTVTIPFLTVASINVTGISNVSTLSVGIVANIATANVSSLFVNGLLVASNASGLSNINSSNLVGNVANANVALVVSGSTQSNIRSIGALGTALTINGLLVASNASGLSNLNSSNLVGNVANANVALVVSQPDQPNITSVSKTGSLFTINGLLVASNASGLSNINASNLVGNVANANVALVVSQPSQPNITSVGTSGSLFTINGLLVASNASGLSNLNSSNLVGNVANANVALVVSQPSQPNITSVGTSGSLFTINGLLVASNASGLSNLNSSNLVGNVANANVALVVSGSTQSNITSVGTSGSLFTINGLLVASNASGLSNLNSSNLVGNVANANVALVVSQPDQPNITSVSKTGSLFTINGLLVASNASGLSNLNSSNLVGNVANANVALVVSQPAQPNITSVGPLTSLNVAGNSNVVGTLFTTNIVSSGFTSNASNTIFNYSTITIPFIYATTLNISSTANIDSVALNTINVQGVSNLTAVWGSLATSSQPNITSVSKTGSLFTINGLLVASNASGLSNLNSSNLVGNVANANVALVVSQPAQPNITSVGTSGSLFTINGLLVASNASGLSNLNSSNLVGNVANANVALVVSQPTQPNITSVGTSGSLFTINGLLVASNASGLSNLNSSNLVGNVANANVALVVSQPSQPNITQVGTLSGLFSSGNVTASFFSGGGNLLSNLNSSNLVGNVANANVALVVSQPDQPNITSVGTSGTLFTINGLLVASNASGLSNLNSSNLVGNVANANVALVVSQPDQPNITSVGLLTNLAVTNSLTTTNVFVSSGLDVGPNELGTNVVVFSNISGGSNVFVMDSRGRIGIGTAVPTFPLTVITSSSAGTGATLGVLGTSVETRIRFLDENGTTVVPPGILSHNTGFGLGLYTNSGGSPIRFFTSGQVLANERMRITDTGVSILTGANPTSNLQVTGNAFVSNAVTTTNVFVSNGLDVGPGTLGTNVVVFSNISGGSNTFVMDSNGRVSIGAGTNGGGSLLSFGQTIANKIITLWDGNPATEPGGASAFFGFGVNSGVLRYQVNGLGDDHIFYGAGNEYARITNVGISVKTGADPTANLQVTGNIHASNALSTTNVFAITATVPGFTSQFTVNGGGTVTYSSAGNLLWSNRVIVIPAWKNAAYATAGYWDITCPTSGTIVRNGGTATCTAAGIPVSVWFALYYRVVPGTSSGSVQANFLLKDFNDATYSPDSNWILLAVRNGDGNEIKWMPGNTTIPLGGTFYTPSASYDKVQVAGTVVVDSARTGIFANLYSANALQTTNLFANTMVLSNATARITGNLYVSNAVTTTNLFTAGISSDASNTIFNSDTLTIPFVYSTTLNVSSTSNLVTANILTLNAVSANISSANLVTANILTLNATTANILTLNAVTANATNLTVRTLANISTLNVYTSANILSGNLVTANITNLTVSSQANIFSANVQNLALATPVAVNSGLFMNLDATYTLNATGNWTGNIAGSITSNLFTLFASNPTASWTKYGSNPLIIGPTTNGGFRFNQTGPYQFTVVLTSDNNIKTVALSSNTSDVHSNLANPGVWLYCYRISVGQDPSVPVQIPFYVDSTSKYYYIDFEAVNKTNENIHRTAYTNVIAEGYTGSYVTLRPL